MLFLTHVYDTKMYLKKLFDKRFRRIFPQLSNDVGSFSEIFHFHLQKVQKVLYLKKYIFNIFFYPLNRKLSIFLRRKGYFPKSARDVFCEK